MTIIAVQGHTMVADSGSYMGGRFYPHPGKIVRASDGSLVGGCGPTVDTYALRQWVLQGMPMGARPEVMYPSSNDESLLWLWLKPDGSLWKGDAEFRVHPVPNQLAIGIGSEFVEGAWAVGADVVTAVKAAIARIEYLGGEIQVERLNQ